MIVWVTIVLLLFVQDSDVCICSTHSAVYVFKPRRVFQFYTACENWVSCVYIDSFAVTREVTG